MSRLPLILILLPQVAAGGVPAASGEDDQKHLVVVCNGYADARPVHVGEQPVQQPVQQTETLHPIAKTMRLRKGRKNALKPAAANQTAQPHEHEGRAGKFLQTQSSMETPILGRARRHRLRHGAVEVAAPHFRRFGTALAGGWLWTRSLQYGMCEEYFVDLRKRRLIFTRPDNVGHCELTVTEAELQSKQGQVAGLPAEEEESGRRGRAAKTDTDVEAGKQEGEEEHVASSGTQMPFKRFAAVVTRPLGSSPNCTVMSREVPLPIMPALAGNPSVAQALATEAIVAEPALPPGEVPSVPAELVLLDAYTHSALTKWEQDNALSEFTRPGSESVVRLEDIIEDNAITAEVLSSRTLSLDHVYSIEARKFHLMLEDLQGARVFNQLDVEVKPGRTYVGLRLGLGGEEANFPEHLAFYECQRMSIGAVSQSAEH